MHTAVVAFADPVEGRGVAHRQRAKHHGIDQRVDRGRAADAQSERQDCRGGEAWGETELTECITDVRNRAGHPETLYRRERKWLRAYHLNLGLS